MSIDDLREITASSAIEVERVCRLFNYLKDFVGTESTKPELSAMSIPTLVVHAAEKAELLFKEGGISLRLIIPDLCPLVLINRARTLEALSSVLLSALGISRRKDIVELIVSVDQLLSVQILVQNVNAQATALTTEACLAMALAESLFRSQQCAMSWSMQSFRVQIDLSKSSPAT